MPFCRTAAKIVLGMALTCLSATAGRADEGRATYEAQAGYAMHLLESGRYGEAADAAQNLVTAFPDLALPYALRGTTALYVGSVGRAGTDFRRAADTSPDPAAQYGLALCALFQHRNDTASAALTLAGRGGAGAELSAEQADDVDTARAYVRLLSGDAAGARAIAGHGDVMSDPLRTEVVALAIARTDPKAGAALLAEFLATPGGVPRVREEDGIRPLFDPAAALEASVTEPDLQRMYADRLTGDSQDAAKRTGTVRACSGLTDLNPPDTLPLHAALISYSVDGAVAAMVNQPPYTYIWDTRRAANGTHTIRVDAADRYGNTLLSQTETVRVSNKSAAARQAETVSPALSARLWSLLRLRPCRKVAEWTVAQAARAAGDTVSADTHLAVAAALDPGYKEGRRTARALFGAGAPGILWTGSAARKQVALTFDDGPNPARTPALLDALDKSHAPATFFVVGTRAEQAPDLLRRMAKRGDEVENHSYTHPNMNLLLSAEAEGEMLRASVVIQALSGHQPRFFRPPGGNANASVQRLSRSYGLSLAYWTVDALHAEDAGSPSQLVAYVLKHVRPGAIILLHNGPEVTATAVPALAAALRGRGYTLVTLSQIAVGNAGTKAGVVPKMKE